MTAPPATTSTASSVAHVETEVLLADQGKHAEAEMFFQHRLAEQRRVLATPAKWYEPSSREVLSPLEMPLVAVVDVAMTSRSLQDYVKKGVVPPEGESDFVMELARRSDHELKVVGVWEDHFPEFCKMQQPPWQPLSPRIQSQAATDARRFYGIRPSLVVVDLLDKHGYPQGKPFYVLVATPGRDYLLQYGHMLRLLVSWLRETAVSDSQIEVWSYPHAITALRTVTAFHDVAHELWGATVILGYVEQFAERFAARHTSTLRAEQDDFVMTANGMYGHRSFVVQRPTGDTVAAVSSGGQRVVLLGVRYPYWGDIAGRLAELVARAGATCILYAGKCGAMSLDIKSYETPIIPSQYAVLEPEVDPATNSLRGDYRPVPHVSNVLARLWPSRCHGAHVSGTTMGLLVLRASDGRGCTSIDKVTSRMAAAIAELPAAADGTRVSFGSVHFATDRVRDERERYLRSTHDLSSQDKIKRDAVLSSIADLLAHVVVEVAGGAGQQHAG